MIFGSIMRTFTLVISATRVLLCTVSKHGNEKKKNKTAK